MAHLTRAAALHKVAMAEAVNAGQAGGDHLTNWQKQHRMIAGLEPF